MTPAAAPTASLPSPRIRREAQVNEHGEISGNNWRIALGKEFAGRTAVVTRDGLHVRVVIDGEIIRDFDADPTRHYQPNGRPRGGPRRRPLSCRVLPMSRDIL